MRRPLIGARDFEAFIGQGEQAQGRSWRLTKEEGIVCMEKNKKEEEEEEEECEEDWLLVLMCARIKHGGNVCKNQA
jgi:hypothetical protein